MKRVLFRADAMPRIGTGDLMSLIRLSDYFKADSWECFFLVKDYPTAVELVNSRSLERVHFIPAGSDISEEVRQINDFIDREAIDLVFFEITERPLSEYTGLDKRVKKACVSFDGAILPDLDLVIDWDVAARSFFEPEKHPDTRFLFGPEYVILPMPYYTDPRISEREYGYPAKNVLITMGGADQHNFTRQILDILLEKELGLTYTVVTGAGYPFHDDLKTVALRAQATVVLKQNVQNMLDEYLACDLAISAGGLTASEILASRTPAVLYATEAHQKARCEYFMKQGWARYNGHGAVKAGPLLDAVQRRIIPSAVPAFNTMKILQACNEIR